MSKKKRSRVLATAVMHLCEDGTYCMSTPLGWARKDLVGLSWAMLRLAMNDLRIAPLPAAETLDAAIKEFAERAAAPYRQLEELRREVQEAIARSALSQVSAPSPSQIHQGAQTSQGQNIRQESPELQRDCMLSEADEHALQRTLQLMSRFVRDLMSRFPASSLTLGPEDPVLILLKRLRSMPR